MKDSKKNIKKIIIASDHAGYRLKETIKKFLIKKKEMSLILEQTIQTQLIIQILRTPYLKK